MQRHRRDGDQVAEQFEGVVDCGAAHMSAKADASIEKIAKRLRQEWSDLVNSPLPERLLVLLTQLERWDQCAPPPPNQPKRLN